MSKFYIDSKTWHSQKQIFSFTGNEVHNGIKSTVKNKMGFRKYIKAAARKV